MGLLMDVSYKMLGFQLLSQRPLKSRILQSAPLSSGEDTSRDALVTPHGQGPTLKLLDARQLGRVEQPVGERLVLERYAAELLPAIHVPGAHAHADLLRPGILVEILTHALQDFGRG